MTSNIHRHVSGSQRLLSPSMLGSKNSQCLQYSDVQSGVSLAVWGNREDQIVTEYQGVHTLSLYLEGGKNAFRKDMKHLHGGPGKVCYMPAGHVSEWHVEDPLRLLHIYFTEAHVDYLGVTAFDVDPRLLQLHDLTYYQDEQLTKGLQSLFVNIHELNLSDKVLLQERQQSLVLYLLQRYSQRKIKPVRGGLSPYIRRRVLDYIAVHMGQDISLQNMADVACLSSYHFARMFRQSTGLSPYQFLLKLRMQTAAEKLRRGDSLMRVASDCGYDNHSRFSRAFRKTYGMTPSEFQASHH